MQKVTLMGFIGKDPEEKTTATGKRLVTFSLAVKIGKELTQWYSCNFWGDRIEFFKGVMPHLKKGSHILLLGDLNIPTIYTNQSGESIVNMSVSPLSINFCGSSVEKEKPKEQTSVFEQAPEQSQFAAAPQVHTTDDLPF